MYGVKMATQYDSLKQAVRDIYRQYTALGGDPAETVQRIDEAIGGITAVRFNAGKRFTISNHNFAVSLPHRSGKRDRPVFALAYAGYLQAQRNGSRQPGEVHISRQMSTKHHREGLEQLLN